MTARERGVWMGLGCLALAAYFLLFSAGLLLSSRPYRDQLQALNASGTPAPAAGSAAEVQLAALPHVAAGSERRSLLLAFAGSVLLYSPLNVALLTLLAGFLGGCASGLTFPAPGGAPPAAKDGAPGASEAKAEARRTFLGESPFASMFRSFLVYLTFMAGIFITTEKPFDAPTADQYARLAGMLSLFAFVVGYDPTKFQDFLDMVPRRGKGTS
jgi:hypothetical protein